MRRTSNTTFPLQPTMPNGEAAGLQRLRNRIAKRSPLLWIMVTPVVTLPLSALLLFTLGGEHDANALGLPAGDLCKFQGHIAQTCFYYFDFWRTGLLLAAPGVLNLAVALWLLYRNGYVRVAAVVALTLAVVRTLIVPMATVVIAQFDVLSDGGLLLRVEVEATGSFIDVNSPSDAVAIRRLLTAAWIGGAMMWGVTAVVWLAYEPLMASFWRGLEPPSGPRLDAPKRWTGFLRRR